MSESINNIICVFLQVMTFLIFIKILFNLDLQLFKIKNIFSFLVLNLVTMLIYSADYSGIETILVIMLLIILLAGVYNFKLSKAFLSAGLFMLVLSLSDMLTSIIFINFASFEQLRGEYFIYANLSVTIITIIIISINKIKKTFLRVINACDNKNNFETIVTIFLIICTIIIIAYITANNFYLNKFYILGLILIIIFFILTLILFKEKYEKQKVVDKYDQLFEYVKTFEEWMDTENMNIHESKNQLATLRDIVKRNKKAVEYIDNIINERANIKQTNIEKLRYIPKGGLKGLLYYKITVAENNGVSIFIDASKNSNAILSKFDVAETKDLCRLLGIFLDNAIEAAKETNKKFISCEIYIVNESLNIVISNSFSKDINLEKIKISGYTTKGKGRGKGLYLAEKISNNNPKILTENRIINNYYVQKIIIKK